MYSVIRQWAPRPGDDSLCVEPLTQGYDFIEKHLHRGLALIHCTSGKDRTGLFMAYCRMRLCHMEMAQALDQLFKVRSSASRVEGWREFAPQVLGSLRVSVRR